MSKEQVVYELHRPARKNFVRRRFIQKGLDDTWQIDLIDMQKYSKHNRGYKYILACIDTFSKYAWLAPIKNKTAQEVVVSMRNILKTCNRIPKNIQSDDGTEFFNTKFRSLMNEYCINHYSSYSVMKASIVERFIRTIKNWLWQSFSASGNYKWIDFLPKVVIRYNNTKHSTTKMKPSDVNSLNANQLLNTVYNNLKIKMKAKYKVGDHVRISKHKSVFDKGYTGNWTTEIFKIRKVQNTQPVTYLLEDEFEEPLLGGFYEEELQIVKHPDIFLVERVIKRKGDKVLVKWLGMSSKHNSWINKDNRL